MIRIALDAMGGDNAPDDIINGGLAAAEKISDLELLLVGPKDTVASHLSRLSYPRERISIINASEVITSDEAPVLSMRRKKDASMAVSMRLVKEGLAEAAVSAGSTGALVAGGLLIIGRMEGIERPALPIVIPSFAGGSVVLLDVGANMDAKAFHLLQYALMGQIYAREVLSKSAPRVGLLNVGSEENKGNEQVRQAYVLIKDNVDNFIGNVEARDIFSGTADVIICDGFVGNILLKSVEGLVGGIFSSIRESFMKDFRSRAGAFLLLPQMRKLKEKLDYEEYGGAPLLGVDGICIKSHGSSDAKAICSTIINQAYRFAKQNVNQQINQTVKSLACRKDGKE